MEGILAWIRLTIVVAVRMKMTKAIVKM